MLPLLPRVLDYEKILRSMQALALTLSALCAGCQSMGRMDEQGSARSPRVLVGLRPVAGLNLSAIAADPTQDLWARLGQGFTLLDNNGSNLRIEQQRDWFVSNPSFLGVATCIHKHADLQSARFSTRIHCVYPAREPGLIANEPAFIRFDLQSNATDQN